MSSSKSRLSLLMILFGSIRLVHGVTPVEKVIELLGKLQVQVEENGKAEAVEYDRFACFCKDQTDIKQYNIEQSNRKIEVLAATITDLSAQVDELNNDIVQLGSDIAAAETAHGIEMQSSATAHEAYKMSDASITDSIRAVDDAIAALQASKLQLKGNAKLNLLQLRRSLTETQMSTIERLVLSQQPAAYTYNSNQIIDILQGLLKTFKEQKRHFDESESQRFDISQKKLLGLANTKQFKEQDKAQKEALVGTKTEALHQAEGERTSETTARDADTQFQTELTGLCEEKAKEFDSRSKARAAEISALEEGISILKSGVAPNYGANKKLVGLAAVHTHRQAVGGLRSQEVRKGLTVSRQPTSFLQKHQSTEVANLAQSLLELLDFEAARIHSPILAALAAKISAQADPFVNVRGLIKDLIARLDDEKSAEGTQKEFCDSSMATAITSRDSQQLQIEAKTTEINANEAAKASLLQDIAALSQEIADLTKGLNEATELRKEESKNNAKTSADAAAGAAAVREAISLLEVYYSTQGAEGGFLQVTYTPSNADREGMTVADRAPKMSYSGDYRGSQQESKGILGLLQIIMSDFDRTVSTVDADEKAAQGAFEKYQSDTNGDIKAKSDDQNAKESEVTSHEEAIINAKGALKDAVDLHEAALNELNQLQAMCVDGESWETRKAQREKEIEALKRALEILDTWKA